MGSGLLVAIVWALSSVSYASETLYLFGGGERPSLAIREFVRAAGVDSPQIQVVAWAAAQDPEASARAISEELQAWGAQTRLFLAPPRTDEEYQSWDQSLLEVDAVFFSGGDQSRILDALLSTPRGRLSLERLRGRVSDGLLFAGTSAGAAVVGSIAITGTTTPLREGIGLIPRAIVDTHFFKRNREKRLRGFLESSPGHLGLGIDEDGAIRVEVGESGALEVTNVGPQRLLWLLPGDSQWERREMLPGEVKRRDPTR